MKVYCALEDCRHHTVSSDEVGFVDFPDSSAAIHRWIALTHVRHVVRGVTRLCTDHFLPHQLEHDEEWERRFPGEVNPNPRLRPGVVPTLGVPGWLEQSDLDLEEDMDLSEPPNMFVRQDGSSARRVKPTARLQEARFDLFDELPPMEMPMYRRGRGRPPKGRRGRPPLSRQPIPQPDLSDPEVRARLVQQALDEYDWRQARAVETGVERGPDGTETLYVSMPGSDEEDDVPRVRRARGRRGGTAVRSRRGRGIKRRRGAHIGADGDWMVLPKDEPLEPEEPPLAERLPPNTSQRFREVLAAQREVQALLKQLEATPTPPADPGAEGGDGDGDDLLLVLRGSGALTTDTFPKLEEDDHYSTPASLEVALASLHRQRLANLRLRGELVRAAIRERQRGTQLADARAQASEAGRGLQERLGDMFTPAQLRLIQNGSLRRTHAWDTVDIKRAIGLRRLCTRRAYSYVKDVLRVPLPGLAVLRGSAQRDPETALMYAQMVQGHRLKHMTKRAARPPKPARPGRTAPTPAADDEEHEDHKYIVLTTGKDGEAQPDAAEAAELLRSVQEARAAGQTVLVDASGAPLLVDRGAGQSPGGDEHYLMLVPEGEEGDEVEEVEAEEEEEEEEAPEPQPQRRRPGILRAPAESREPPPLPAGARVLASVPAAPPRPRFKLVVKGDGEVTTEDGRPLEEVSWPAGLQWMDAAQVNLTTEVQADQ